MTNTDPIVEKVRAIRRTIAKESGDNLRKIVSAARKRQDSSGREVVHLDPRPTAAVVTKAS